MFKKILGYIKREVQLNEEYYQGASTSKGTLTFAEKERILVDRVTTADMVQFEKMPYNLNCTIHKFTGDYAHTFAYINLFGHNITTAKESLEKVNRQIHADGAVSPVVPSLFRIPLDDIVFTPSKEHGYTRLICTPYTFDGNFSEYPLTLSFMTDLTNHQDTTHGALYYDVEGRIAKADVYFWRENEGFFYYYETLEGSFRLSKVEHMDAAVTYRPPALIYRDEYWIKLEAMRKKEAEDFEWVKINLPEKCPKSVSGYRRMKHTNSKNFQALIASAKELGRDIA